MSKPASFADAICEFLTSFYSKENVGKSRAAARKNGITLEEAAAEGLAKYLLERFDLTPKKKVPEKRPREAVKKATKSKVMKVNLWLRVENNNKFVRGKKKVREEIEQFVLSRYAMEKDGVCEYTLTIPYETDKELDSIIEEILSEADRRADYRHCFIEADATSVDDPDRSW